MNNFETKKNIVKNGNSKVFADWKKIVSTLTKEEFLTNLQWVCEDPSTKEDGSGLLTREIGLTKSGIVKLDRKYSDDFTLCTFYDRETGKFWNGDTFKVPCTEEYVKNSDEVIKMGLDDCGFIMLNYKISLSAKDRV